ncbi:MAG: hypothetical protein EP343_00780 [Deltaproteobacteria bacterium]|nr:MAG: hypothetical protein EP343_00780 [Deltaproteobacteria bacterium]
MTNLYRGQMSKEEGKQKLQHLAARLGLSQNAIRIRRMPGSRLGKMLSFTFQDIPISRGCDSQPTAEGNEACLIIWLGDLVRNIERRIETFEEAFYAEGGHLLPAQADPYAETRSNAYRGNMTEEEALQRLERALQRLGISKDDVNVKWNPDTGVARLRMRLQSGRVVEKFSSQQKDSRTNLCALTMWLQTRAKNWERGIERDMDRLFAANLLPLTPEGE